MSVAKKVKELEEKLVQEGVLTDDEIKLALAKEKAYQESLNKDMSKSELEKFYKEEVKRFKESRGFLSKNKRILYSLTHNSWVLIKNNNIEIIPKEETVKAHLQHFYNIPPKMLMEAGKTSAYLDFDAFKELEIFDEDNYLTINLFDENKTKLGLLRKIRAKNKPKYNKLNFLRRHPHFNLLFSNVFHEDNLDYVINWIATAINTREKLLTTLLIISNEGPGKGFLNTHFFEKVYGKDYLANVNNSDLKSDRNEIFENKLFVVFNEVRTDIKSDIHSKIKELITDPYINIRRIYGSPTQELNRFNALFYSNEAEPLKIGMTNRRISVINLKKYNQQRLEVRVMEEMGLTMKEFTKNIEAELDGLLADLALFNYDEVKANTTIQNEAVQEIMNRTSTKEEVLKKYLMDVDFKRISRELKEAKEIEIALKGNLGQNVFNAELKNLHYSMSNGYLTNKDIVFLYRYFIKEGADLSERKISYLFNSLVGKTKPITSNGVSMRVRLLLKKYEGPFDIEDSDDEEVELTLDEKIKESGLNDELTSYTTFTNCNDLYEEMLKYSKNGEELLINKYDIDFEKNGFIYFTDDKDNTLLCEKKNIDKEMFEKIKSLVIPF